MAIIAGVNLVYNAILALLFKPALWPLVQTLNLARFVENQSDLKNEALGATNQ